MSPWRAVAGVCDPGRPPRGWLQQSSGLMTGHRPPSSRCLLHRGSCMTQEHDHQPALLNLADMMGPISHELRNIFNNMVLNTAILARAVPENLRSQVAEFKSLALRANEMLTILDHHRQRIVAIRRPLDLNEVVEEAMQQFRAKGVEVTKQTAAGLPPVWGNQAEISRLIQLLVGTCKPPLEIRTEHAGSVVQ